jgi:hypothetical protein
LLLLTQGNANYIINFNLKVEEDDVIDTDDRASSLWFDSGMDN